MEQFIKNYFRLLNLKNMPDTVLDRYKKYIKDNDFPNKDVKSWKDLMKSGTEEWQDLPDFSTLSEDDLNLLYVDLLKTFEEMLDHQDKLSDDAKNFVNEFYGKNKPFPTQEIPASEKQQIRNLIQLLLNDSDVIDMDLLGYDDDEILRDVLNGQRKPEDKAVRRSIFNIIKNIRQAKIQGHLSAAAETKLSAFNLESIQKAVKQFSVDDVTQQNRDALKSNGDKIFKTLFDKKKTFDDFKKYESGEKFVSELIDSALSNTDYTGKINEKNYVPPKYEDDLNLKQKIDKTLDETYSDVLKKFLTLHRANLFIKPEAKAIFAALDKAKIKPTDGIKTVLEKAGDVSKALKGKQPFEADDHFKWMTDKLSDYQNNGMGKAIEGALRNGHQMKHIIEQLVIDAVKEGKTKEAKTAMEVLSVMQYGLFTSRTMDAINQTDMTIFSDGKLSWNKNEGIQFVTKAADRTLKAGLQLAGYGATAAVNSIRRIGSTFDRSGKINDMSEARKKELAKNKADFDSDKAVKDAANDVEIHDNEIIRTATGITDINASKAKLKTDREHFEAQRKMVYDKRQDNFEKLDKIKKDYEKRTVLNDQRTDLLNEVAKLASQLKARPNPDPNQYEATISENIRKLLDEKKQAVQQNIADIKQITDEYTAAGMNLDAEYSKINTIVPPATQSPYDISILKRDKAKTAYENQKQENDDLEQKINEYEEATENIDTAKKQKQDRQKNADEWNDKNKNEYMELMAYWDFLQSGSTKSLFHISTKKLQKKMDAGRMQTMLNDWNKSYAA